MNNYSIEQVVPHDSPMILIDQLVDYSDENATCSVTITPQSPFYSEQIEGVPSYIGVEYMAQSIAAYAGALAKDINEAVKIGFLIGTRKYKTHQATFYKSSTLTIFVQKLYQEESGLSVFECQITENKKILCDAKINVFQPENPLKFIRENQ
ncbi:MULTISPECIES: hotdog family protein [unclassified Pseudoalteromonas]|jgi:predicted hotdog family 3-hydroxylacyl-ACP dehydratase|uniref:hotdog family protein n=1 Tax=unclassified Pseudoalteromonas TaxID=194690 RepID=UPI0025738B7A|nr:hotdog family protein [Pseudoalteromonas sp. MM1]BED91172.1 thioester dehydrase [Pseudoalteromonas sp. MM1]